MKNNLMCLGLLFIISMAPLVAVDRVVLCEEYYQED